MPKETTDKHRSSYIPFRCSPEMYETIKKIAEGKNLSMSEVLRSLVDAGLVKQGYTQDEDYLYKLVGDAVKEQLQPAVERLAAISAKGTQIAGATFFMNIFAASTALPERERERIEDAAGRARELGIQYLKLDKKQDTDTYLRQGAAEIIDTDE